MLLCLIDDQLLFSIELLLLMLQPSKELSILLRLSHEHLHQGLRYSMLPRGISMALVLHQYAVDDIDAVGMG